MSRCVNRQGESEERPDDVPKTAESAGRVAFNVLVQPSLLTTPDLEVKGPSQVGSQVLQIRTGTRGQKAKDSLLFGTVLQRHFDDAEYF